MDIDQMVRRARLAQRGHVFVDTTTCVCGYGSETGEDWERHQVEVALRAVMAPLSTTGEDAETEKLTEGRPTEDGGAWGSYVAYLDTLENDIEQLRVERDWLLAEAPDELRARFFSIGAAQWRDAHAPGFFHKSARGK